MPIPLVAAVSGVALTSMASAILQLYGVVSDVNDFINEQIDKMKQSENSTISRTGRVIEGAKFGFGIGYIVPISIIAVGQMLLGNTGIAIGGLASAAVFSNPIAMTCAAVGAIFYGWNALSAREQNETLERVSEGLEVGVELLKSVITFVINKTKELLSTENIQEMKRFISDAAQSFGNTLADVTRAIKDRALCFVDDIKGVALGAGQVVATTTSKAGGAVKNATKEVGTAVAKTFRGEK